MKIKLDNLTKLELGKLDRLLDKKYRLLDNSVFTLRELINNGEIIGKEVTRAEEKFNRNYYNKLAYLEQVRYEKDLVTKNIYNLKLKSGGIIEVSKTVFKAVSFVDSVQVGSLEITSANYSGIMKLAVDSVNRAIKDFYKGEKNEEDIKRLLKDANLKEMKKAGIMIKSGYQTNLIPEDYIKAFEIINNGLLNDFIIELI